MVSLRRDFFYSLFIACVLALCVSTSANAQQVFGSIIGTVTDPSGSAVNNAKVTITDVTKGTSSIVTTNESGAYSKGQLNPDNYKVTIEAPGFQKAVANELTVQVDQATQFNAALQVGNVSQEVEVTAAAPLLQTDRADVDKMRGGARTRHAQTPASAVYTVARSGRCVRLARGDDRAAAGSDMTQSQ